MTKQRCTRQDRTSAAGQGEIQVIPFCSLMAGSLLLRLLKGERCNTTGVAPFFKATRHLENSRRSSVVDSRMLTIPVERQLGLGRKLFEGKPPLNSHHKKLQPTHNPICHWEEKSVPKFLGEKRQVESLSPILCFASSLDQRVAEELLHTHVLCQGSEEAEAGFHPSQIYFGSGRSGAFVSRTHCILGLDRAAPSKVSTQAHVRLSVKSPWFSNSCGFTAVKTETSYDCLPDCMVTK